MPSRRERPDLDERFSLHPLEGERVLEELLGTDATHEDGEEANEPSEGQDAE